MNATNYPETPGSKVAGPSIEAAKVMKASAATLRDRCLIVLFSGDATADEVANFLQVDRLAIRPRMAELNVAGKIFDSGIRRKNESGLNATVWSIHEPFSLEL